MCAGTVWRGGEHPPVRGIPAGPRRPRSQAWATREGRGLATGPGAEDGDQYSSPPAPGAAPGWVPLLVPSNLQGASRSRGRAQRVRKRGKGPCSASTFPWKLQSSSGWGCSLRDSRRRFSLHSEAATPRSLSPVARLASSGQQRPWGHALGLRIPGPSSPHPSAAQSRQKGQGSHTLPFPPELRASLGGCPHPTRVTHPVNGTVPPRASRNPAELVPMSATYVSASEAHLSRCVPIPLSLASPAWIAPPPGSPPCLTLCTLSSVGLGAAIGSGLRGSPDLTTASLSWPGPGSSRRLTLVRPFLGGSASVCLVGVSYP